MTQSPPYIALAPGENHICHIERLFDSIAQTITTDHQFCVLLPSENCRFRSKHNVISRVLTSDDKRLCESIYFREGRADIPSFVYAQLLLPLYFKESRDILFMEVDQIVRGDLAPLFTLCRERNSQIAAVRSRDEDGNLYFPESFKRHFPGRPYFNMGVVYVNTESWLKSGFTDRCVEEAKEQLLTNGQRYDFYAQGAMNNALSESILELDFKYNTTGLGYRDNIQPGVLDRAVVLHWSGSRKPWASDGLYPHLYFTQRSLMLRRLSSMAQGLAKTTMVRVRKMAKRILVRPCRTK